VFSAGDNTSWIGLWGQTNEDSANGSLGTGIVLLKSTFVGTNEDKDQHLIIGRAKAGETFTYFAGGRLDEERRFCQFRRLEQLP
jgi:hypothetical protein